MKTLVLRFARRAGVGAAAFSVLAGLAGCFDNDPGMQERLMRTQVELQDVKQKLLDSDAALQKAQASLKLQAAATPPPAPTPFAPSKEQLNDGYIAAAKEMRDQLKSELTGYSILNCTLYEVSTVAAMPYTSKVAVALKADKGQQFKLEMPVGADSAGKWKFPTTQEILDNIAKNPPKAIASNTQPAGSGAGNPQDSQRPKPFEPRAQDRPPTPPQVTVAGTGDGSVETVTLNWSQSQTHSSGQPRAQSAAPAPPQAATSTSAAPSGRMLDPRPAAPRPAPAAQPAPAMASDQSVLVTF